MTYLPISEIESDPRTIFKDFFRSLGIFGSGSMKIIMILNSDNINNIIKNHKNNNDYNNNNNNNDNNNYYNNNV